MWLSFPRQTLPISAPCLDCDHLGAHDSWLVLKAWHQNILWRCWHKDLCDCLMLHERYPGDRHDALWSLKMLDQQKGPSPDNIQFWIKSIIPVQMPVLGQNWHCYGACGFVMASQYGLFYFTGPILVNHKTRNSWDLPVMDHNWPSTLHNYGKPVECQCQATSGPELCHSSDIHDLVVHDDNSSNFPIQNDWLFHHWGFKFMICQVSTPQLYYFFGRIVKGTFRITTALSIGSSLVAN